MAQFKEANERLFKNLYICMKTNSKVRMPIGKFLNKKFSLKRGVSKQLRPVKLKSKK